MKKPFLFLFFVIIPAVTSNAMTVQTYKITHPRAVLKAYAEQPVLVYKIKQHINNDSALPRGIIYTHGSKCQKDSPKVASCTR